MRKQYVKPTLFVVMLICLACQPQPELDLAEVQKSIEETNAKLSEAVANADAEAFAACFTADAESSPPNAARVSGREEIKASMEQMFAMGMSGLELQVTEVSGAGDMVYETGTYKATITPGGQDVMAIMDHGKYMVIWKKESDGVWRLHRDIWNSDLPMEYMDMSSK